ncbi:MAG: DUF2062 domain-containing protein [Bacteroidales bacterium]|nr:DUF2062 domain-containing protein [Bacteroidales bacterium]
MKASRTDIFSDLNCCIIVPTYNNAGTLRNVLDGILRHTSHVIVVNDGSTDQTKDILHLYKDIKVIENKINRGKGHALKKSFRIASETGYEYAITIDSDGQHDPDDLPKFRSALKENPETLIIGARNMDQQGIPGKSSFGHKFSNFWFLVETGIKLPDTQTGYRLYPIKRISGMLFFTNKFEFEIEVLVRTAWKGIPVTSIPVNVYYPPAGKRISHFRPFRDFARVSILNSVLVLLAFLYFRPILYFKDFNLKKLKKLLGSGESSLKLSMATGFGVFMGIIPIWGFQMITAAFLAHIFRLNKALVLVASNISIPPMMPVIIYLSFVMGRIFVANPVYIAFNKHITLESAKISFIQYIYGSIPLAISAGLLAAIFTYIFLYFRRNGRKK